MYQYIVLDSIFNLEKDGEYAGFIDVNGKAYKEKAIRDDNIAGEILTSLLELVGAIVVSVFTAGAAAGAYTGRIASFIAKGISYGKKIQTTIVNFAGKIGGKLGQAAAYGAKSITTGYVKAASDVGKAAIFGVPARILKGDKPADILKGYGVAILGGGSLRTVGTAAYDNFLFRRLIKDTSTPNFQKNIKTFIKYRKEYISLYGVKNQFNKYISKVYDDILTNNAFDVDDLWKLQDNSKLRTRDIVKILKLRRYSNSKFFSKEFISRNLYSNDVTRKSFTLLSSQISDDVAKAVLKGAEAQSLLKITNKLTGVLQKYLIARILQLENTKLAKRLLTTYINLFNKKKDLLKKINKGLKQLKDKFYKTFNFERVKAIFDKQELKTFKEIRETSYDYKDAADKKTKEAIANDFIAKNQKLLLFDDNNKSEGGFGSRWLLGYKWIAKYDKNTNEILDTGNLRIYFKARIPKKRYRIKNVRLKYKDKNGDYIFEDRKVENKLFKAAITFKQVPFQRFEEMISSASPGQYYWNVFAKQPNNTVMGKNGWKPRTYADIDFLMNQQNIAGIYGLQVKGLSEEVLKKAMGYSTTGQNILKFQGKTREIISFIKSPLKKASKTVRQNISALNVIKRTNR